VLDINCDCVGNPIAGCLDACAPNFNPLATIDDGSCQTYSTVCNTDCNTGDIQIWDAASCGCITDIVTVNGCTDPSAANYNSLANCDDGSCNYPCPDPGNCNDGICANGEEVWDDNTCTCVATNIPNANCDDGICTNGFEIWNEELCICDIIQPVLGCTDPDAENYDPDASCEDNSCISNNRFYLPNTFSPNDDGNNDYFTAAFYDAIESIEINIYDRWGNRLFRSDDINFQWDGTHKGQRLNVGVFVYAAVITFTDGETRIEKGNVTLIR